VRWRLSLADIQHLVTLQEQLFREACERTKPGGVIVYSTCSIEPEENEELVRKVIGKSLVLEAEEWSIPGKPADGGYWARLKRGHS
jgi:16S rRNA (cytosine967-C5)-methyltransferase